MESLLENLLRQAVAGRTGTGSSKIVEALSSDDEMQQLQAVEALCTELNMATAMTLTTMNTDAIVPKLVDCLRKQHNPELQLLSARALTYMSDSLPQTLQILARGSNAEILLAPIAVIQDVELAEQCIACLDKLCQTSSGATAAFRCNGVGVMLGFVDFFTASTQQKVWASVSRMCKYVDTNTFDKIKDSLPTIRGAVSHGEAKISGKALSALFRIVCGVRRSSRMVEDVFDGLCDTLVAVVTRNDSDETVFSNALVVSQAAISFSAAAIKQVVDGGLLTALIHLLDVNAGSAGGAADSKRPASPTPSKRSLSYENGKVLCNIFTSLLVPTRDGAFGYIDELLKLELREGATARAPPLADADKENDEDSDLDGDDSEHDDDEEEADDDAGDETFEEIRERVCSTVDLTLRQNTRFAILRGRNHVCDQCGKSVALGDWYRCNECADADYCGSCLVENFKDHFGGEHTYTDMQLLFEAVLVKAKLHTEPEIARQALYVSNPGLLAKVLAAVSKVVLLCLQSEAAVIRASAMEFLHSAASMATPDQLAASGMGGGDVCEAIMTAISDKSLLLNLSGVALASRLLEKLPASYAALLVREGVSNALMQLRKKCSQTRSGSIGGSSSARCKSAERASLAGSQTPLEKRVGTTAGWRGIIGNEVTALLDRVPALTSTSRSDALDRLVELLRADKLSEAGVALAEVVRARTTAYEFASQNVFHELRECMARCDDRIEPILSVVVALCDAKPASAAALSDFIRLLHIGLSHLDSFAPPSFGPVRSMRTSIPLELVPHTPERPGLSSFPKPKRSTADSEKNDDGEKSTSPTARLARVGIEPLASVKAISDFISRNLVNASNDPRAMRGARPSDADGDGRVEEVLPELGAAAAGTAGSTSRSKPKKGTAGTTPSVWIRYENHVLPLSMSMVQLIDKLVQPAGGAVSTTPGGALSKPIRLYYSSTPYCPQYEMYHLFQTIPDHLVSAINVELPSKEARPAAFGCVLAAVRAPFEHSRPYLSGDQVDILTLLAVLYEIVDNWAVLLKYLERTAAANEEEEDEDELVWSPPVSRADFVHHKLNNKAMRHCAHLLLAGQHSSTWAVNLALDCNFIFTPSTRKFMFEVSFCGTVRSLARMQQNLARYGIQDRSSADHLSPNVQLNREKKRVWREHPLECAMELLGGPRPNSASAWEFEFYNEAGSGLGPTREFYTLVSKALCERSLQLWRPSSNEAAGDKYFSPLNGLYPRPIATNATKEQRDSMSLHFKFIGRFIGRALLDEHVASLPLSPTLIKLFRGDSCGVHDICPISESLCDVLLAMAASAQAPAANGVIQLPGQKKAYPVESMSLQFTLPGDDSIELKPSGASLEVSRDNMLEYCDDVTGHMLKAGVADAVVALRQGFNDYIPLTALRMLSVEEFFEVVNGYTQPITRQEFEENCLADHGFTISCAHVQWLFDILAGFTLEEQKRFFLFLTGSPHLPVGGLASLRPKLTIVRKTSSEPGIKETDQLPSAMTCQNYLKLPAYESKEQMEEKVRQAMEEGCDAFLLS